MDLKRHAVAAFVAFHAFTVVFLSLPRPSAPGTEEYEDFAEGVRARAPALEGPLRSGVGAYVAGVDGLRRLLGPYTRWAGTSQGWTMFGTVPTDCERFELLVRRDGEWTPLYVAGSREHTWRRTLFENERVRTYLHSVTKPGKQGRRRVSELADWASREVRAVDPEAEAVRVRYVRLVIPRPDELAETRQLREGPVFLTESRPRKSK